MIIGGSIKLILFAIVVMMQLVVAFGGIRSSSNSATGSGGGGGEEYNLLMIGNSYTSVNNLNEIVVQLLQEGLDVGGNKDNVNSLRFAIDAYQWYQMLTSSQSIKRELTNAIMEKQWNWVILQEQSQVPGFYNDNSVGDLYTHSVEALEQLNDMIQSNNEDSMTVLYETWGRLHGDSYNPGKYTDYITMQNYISNGYANYQQTITSSQRVVKIAPAGHAYKAIYMDVLNNNSTTVDSVDPTKPGTTFYNLYSIDGSHPSMQGSYLIACVIYATITGYDPQGIQWAPHEVLYPSSPNHDYDNHDNHDDDDNNNLRNYLQSIAASTVTEFYKTPLLPSPGLLPKQKNQKKQQQQSSLSSSSLTSNQFHLIILIIVGIICCIVIVLLQKRSTSSLTTRRRYQQQQQQSSSSSRSPIGKKKVSTKVSKVELQQLTTTPRI